MAKRNRRREYESDRGRKILITVLALFAVLALAGIFMKYLHDSDRFFTGTRINGIDVSGKTPAEAANVLRLKYGEESRVVVNEAGKEAFSGSLEEFGYVVDEGTLLTAASRSRNIQTGDINTMLRSIFTGGNYVVRIPFTFDSRIFERAVMVKRLKEERIASQDASLSYDEKKKEYSIVPEVQGNELSDEALRSLVKDQVDMFIAGDHAGETLSVDIPESLYEPPSVAADDEGLVNLCQVYNTYVKSSVTYQFGSVTETVDWDTVKDWIMEGDRTAYLREDMVRDYVISLEAVYNTRYHDRLFTTVFGQQILIPASENDYGYTIDEDAETAQLAADLATGTQVTREPVYIRTNSYGNPLFYKREGTDDLAGTYVEVNLSQQHLWFRKDGNVILDSDFVSGSVAKNAETKTGAFPLAYKESPSILVGDNANDGYRTEVTYWMPFFEGQGLHDAVWRSEFGGSIYVNNGSHGCVNLPFDKAQQIYENIEAGMAIILYK